MVILQGMYVLYKNTFYACKYQSHTFLHIFYGIFAFGGFLILFYGNFYNALKLERTPVRVFFNIKHICFYSLVQTQEAV